MIAFVTQPAHPAITPDDELAAAHLRAAGHPVQGIPWTSPDTDWSSFDAVVIRSPWDYHQHPASAFLSFLDRLERSRAPVHNPAPVLKWNAHKRYLLDLAARGIPTVPTTLLPRGTRPSLPDLLAPHDRAVLKPAFAAGAIDTWVTSRDAAPAHQPRLDALLARTDVLLQPYLPQVATDGEWSLVFFDNAFSHAVLKRPKPHDFRVQEKHGGSTQPLTPPDALIAQARHILTTASPAAHAPLLYARVDGVVLDNTFTLMELEALEPALFLSTSPDAPARFARAILSRLPR